MAHTDVATFLADKAVVQLVGFTIHTQLRCVLDLNIIPKAECYLNWKKRIISNNLCRYFNFCQFLPMPMLPKMEKSGCI